MQFSFLPDHRHIDSMGHQDRMEAQYQFIADCGWSEADLFPLQADASGRTYTRLIKSDATALLMDASTPGQNLGAYVSVAEGLSGMGFRVPAIYAQDLSNGLALIEDFGDKTFSNELGSAAGDDEATLYDLALDVLLKLRETPVPATLQVPDYSLDKLLEEVSRFLKWFVPAVRGAEVSEDETKIFLDAWSETLDVLDDETTVLVHRDFHVDNLMLIDGEAGVKRCGLLDFQDAVLGSPVYDLVSLLEDARRDVSPTIKTNVIQRYLDRVRVQNSAALKRDMAILGAQRHTKILGIFVRMSVEKGKHGYLPYIPRVQQQLSAALEHPSLKKVRKATDDIVPDWRTATFTSYEG
ncbi:aminoglycoside phosphotransferase [Kordiimonas sediminis]|uniref:Aminoglycoside phosphotransferase n=1 Tax=Kordiimonas sediminis TaxID=1735581 RepID=A0A919ASL2_9PROT|nr:phosphotransferase [Kordiimonas sediminis]GHF22720.1 aminoglycoside phosphotransferase [Kordiimonas sediminis]